MLPIPLHLIHAALLRDHMSGSTTEEEFLLWMVLIHTHQIALTEPFVQDVPGLTVVEPATQRAAASAIADLWPAREDEDKVSYIYWYRAYQLKTPYETMRRWRQCLLNPRRVSKNFARKWNQIPELRL
jgi:hypothetical protein